jgi:hypothetical protein
LIPAGFFEGGNGRVWILDTRQFDDDAPLSLGLHQGFHDAQRVDAVVDDGGHLAHLLGVDLLIGRQVGFQQHLEPATQVQALADLEIPVDLFLSDLDDAIGQIEKDHDESQDDDESKQDDISVSHTLNTTPPDGSPIRRSCAQSPQDAKGNYTSSLTICQTHLTAL